MRALLPFILMLATFIPPAGHAQQRPAAAADSGESRLALVIGNASYKDAPLANPVNDARAIAKTLNESGFKVKVLVNLTQGEMRRAIREFGDELHVKQGVGLFYFAGHGVQLSNRNFLIPVGADIQREYEVEDQSVDAGAVLSMMQSAKARVNIVILDACRNNPFIRDFRSTINGLAPMQAPAGTLVAFSTAPGQTAIDGTGQHGLYTEHLVEHLAVPGLKIEDVFKNVRVGVQRTSSGRQVPWENTSLTGDFYFKTPVATATSTPTSGASAAEINRAVQGALRERDAQESARRRAQQDEIESAVMAALKRREQEQAAAQASRAERENQEAKAAIERLNKELAELRATRETATAQAERLAAATPQSAAAPPVQVALLEPISRAQPVINVGGRIERPDVRAGDHWKYHVTDRLTNLQYNVVVDVATVTENRIYTRSARGSLAALELTAAAGLVDVWDRDWNQLRQGESDFVPFYPSLQFPLETGKSWSGNVTRSAGGGSSTNVSMRLTYELTANAVGWERVTVPAGTFDAIKIAIRGSFRATGSVNDVIWYAPAIRRFVKAEFQQRSTARARDHDQYERWELVEYKPN